jgi:hypothetical protein
MLYQMSVILICPIAGYISIFFSMEILKKSDYKRWISELKLRIQQSQIKASVRVNGSLIELYWSIGADIVAKQAETVWGSGVFAKISNDILQEIYTI